MKKVFLKSLQNSQEKTCVGFSFSIRLQAYFIKKESPRQVFSCQICEIFKNTHFVGHPRTTTSVISKLYFSFPWSSSTLHNVWKYPYLTPGFRPYQRRKKRKRRRAKSYWHWNRKLINSKLNFHYGGFLSVKNKYKKWPCVEIWYFKACCDLKNEYHICKCAIHLWLHSNCAIHLNKCAACIQKKKSRQFLKDCARNWDDPGRNLTQMKNFINRSSHWRCSVKFKLP